MLILETKLTYDMSTDSGRLCNHVNIGKVEIEVITQNIRLGVGGSTRVRVRGGGEGLKG